MAQLSFADLIERGVPLTASEAASLTLAAGAAGNIPDPTEIFLSSTGSVSFGCTPAVSTADETARLASLLHRLLRLDEADTTIRSRVPGGLLVALARTMRQIDLPALSPVAFHEALARFGAQAEPAILAAIFWRAARMRAPSPKRAAVSGSAGTMPVRTRAERRNQGPTPAELRRWVRQMEREVFKLRQSRAAAASAAVIAIFVVVVTFVIGVGFSESPSSARASTDLVGQAGPPGPVEAPAPLRAVASQRRPPSPSTPGAGLRPGVTRTSSARQSRPRVEMVNLPRAPWAVIRTP